MFVTGKTFIAKEVVRLNPIYKGYEQGGITTPTGRAERVASIIVIDAIFKREGCFSE